MILFEWDVWLVSVASSEQEFQQAVAHCASAGLITADKVIEIRPLFQDFYWHRLHRSDYRQRALNLPEAGQNAFHHLLSI